MNSKEQAEGRIVTILQKLLEETLGRKMEVYPGSSAAVFRSL